MFKRKGGGGFEQKENLMEDDLNILKVYISATIIWIFLKFLSYLTNPKFENVSNEDNLRRKTNTKCFKRDISRQSLIGFCTNSKLKLKGPN